MSGISDGLKRFLRTQKRPYKVVDHREREREGYVKSAYEKSFVTNGETFDTLAAVTRQEEVRRNLTRRFLFPIGIINNIYLILPPGRVARESSKSLSFPAATIKLKGEKTSSFSYVAFFFFFVFFLHYYVVENVSQRATR